MSRIGKKPVVIPQGVRVNLDGQTLHFVGPKGELHLELHPKLKVVVEDASITFAVMNPEEKSERALWGLHRALAQNIINGVNTGFSRQLELIGVGFKVNLQGKDLVFALGFSHPVTVTIPEGLVATVDKNIITITGVDKQLVGQFAANIRRLKPPEPYKGKGIRYVGENVRRKAGKSAKAVGK